MPRTAILMVVAALLPGAAFSQAYPSKPVRLIARSNALPDVPTMKDAGVKAEFPTQWWAFAAPRGTPAAVIGRLNADIGQAMKAPDLQEKYASMGIFTAHTTPERVSELQKSGTKLMAGIVKRAGIQPE